MLRNVLVVLLSVGAALSLFAQAEQGVKNRAKGLKRDIESKQTNQVHGATNTPARR
jgi:hypothetical protein